MNNNNIKGCFIKINKAVFLINYKFLLIFKTFYYKIVTKEMKGKFL